MQTPWQMLWPGFRPVWQFPLLREHIRLPSLWTTGIATDYSASNHLRRLLLAGDLVCAHSKSLQWLPSGHWADTRRQHCGGGLGKPLPEDLQVSPVDLHLLGLKIYKYLQKTFIYLVFGFEVVLGRLESRCSVHDRHSEWSQPLYRGPLLRLE